MKTEFSLVIAILVFLYPFLLYPGLVFLARRRSAPTNWEAYPAELPNLAMVICALNEGKIIDAKIENSLKLNYPEGKLRIIVISDGSTDETASIVRRYLDRGVELIDQPSRRGKVANLNNVIQTLPEKVAVLSDANVLYHEDALLRLMEPLGDDAVGCVSGKVILKNPKEVCETSTDKYYSLEWAQQEWESDVYSMTGADGAMYAIRTALFCRYPNDTIIEDFAIPMAVIRQGYRVVFQSKAIGWEHGASSIMEEYRRKVRIAAGVAQGLIRGSVWPGKAPVAFWFIFISHKLLRWLSPVVGATALLIALSNPRNTLCEIVIAGSASLLVMALIRAVSGSTSRWFEAPFYFLFGQMAMAVGLIKGLLGAQSVLWAKADR